MNKGTILRISALAIAICATLLCILDVVDFPMWARIIIAFGLLVACVVSAYFNNDFSKEACIGTGITRQMKAEKDPDYCGERFFDLPDEELEVEADE